MSEETKELGRLFCVVADSDNMAVLSGKTPRDAATKAFNGNWFDSLASVEVFEIGRGKRYVRQATAVPAGKAE